MDINYQIKKTAKVAKPKKFCELNTPLDSLMLALQRRNQEIAVQLCILRPCLDTLKIPKFYKISHHIESLNVHEVLNIAKQNN